MNKININFSIIGMRIKQARIDKHITQEKLAEMLDVSVAYISRVERGSTSINLKRLFELCALLEVPVSKVLDGTSAQSSSYLTTAFSDLLKNCPPDKLDLAYNVLKVIIES